MTSSRVGSLVLVSTPIGNKGDITLRAIEVLKAVHVVVCEELKIGRRILSSYNIQKELIPLNEHNEEEQTEVILELLRNGNDVALISDAGAPLFADPGTLLVQRCIKRNIKVTSVPGATSLVPALQLCGFDIETFVYVGWLSPKRELRRRQLLRLKDESRVMVILEAPYRLGPLLADMNKIFDSTRRVAIAFDLTTETETVYRGTIAELTDHFQRNPRKGEFVIVVDKVQ